MRKKFNHVDVDLGYTDLKSTTTDSGRRYVTPEGDKLPSVTTVLKILTEKSIMEWRKRVGEEEANKVSRQASSRGTNVHAIVEKYIRNDFDYYRGYMPNIIDNFQAIKGVIDERIDNVYGQEVALYSTHLGLAGRVDCVAEFDGVLSIIDFKTARKPKKEEWISNYFIQESAYAIMFEERTGIPITQLVTLIAVDHHEPQVFIQHRDTWAPKLIETIDLYETRQNAKAVRGT